MSICHEIVVYDCDDPALGDAAREMARARLSTFPGFLRWQRFTGCEDARRRVDFVSWRSLDEARLAAFAVESQNEFKAFRASVSRMGSLNHYFDEDEGAPARRGVEIGRFRLKAGVTEERVRDAHGTMVADCLSRMRGWRAQHLVRLDNDIYVDLAYAEDQASSERICAAWLGEAACDAFLSLIEPESIVFGSIAAATS